MQVDGVWSLLAALSEAAALDVRSALTWRGGTLAVAVAAGGVGLERLSLRSAVLGGVPADTGPAARARNLGRWLAAGVEADLSVITPNDFPPL